MEVISDRLVINYFYGSNNIFGYFGKLVIIFLMLWIGMDVFFLLNCIFICICICREM